MPARFFPHGMLAAALLLAAGCKRVPPHATISGHIEGCKDSIIHLYIGLGDHYDTKYVPIKDGSFSWTDNYPDPQSAVMEVCDQRIQLFLENTDMEINGHIDALDRVKITGSAIQEEYNAYMSSVAKLREEEEYQRYLLSNREGREKEAGPAYDSLVALDKKITNTFISTHPGSIVSVAIIDDLSNSEVPGYLDSLFRLLTPGIVATRDGTQLKGKITGLMKESVGQPLKDFAEVNLNGDTVRLADLKGKTVLIHFWTAYNEPENLTLLRLYNCYHCKNFTVLGVWMGDSKDQWKEWVETEELPWTEVADLKPLDGSMALAYGSRNLSDNLLIDPKGIIIGRYLSMRRLEHKLEEMFH